MSKKYTIPHKDYGVIELYKEVAELMGVDPEDFNFDCRNINVAPNIQDGFFAHYREENSDMPEDNFKIGMAMLLLHYGPKVDETLADDEVEVFDGFIC